jgi:hypothetical protein
MEGLINTIRGIPGGSQNIIAAEGMNYSQDFSAIGTAIASGNGLTDSAHNLIYSAHIYPGTVADASHTSSLNAVLPTSVTSHYPIYVGEWGADINPGPEGAPSTSVKTWNQNMLNWLSSTPYSWTAWAMNADPWLTYQGTTTPTPYFGQLVKDYLTSHKASTVSVAFQDTDDWGTGFVGQISITNNGTTAINSWSLEFDFTGGITNNPDPNNWTNIWNAKVKSHSGNHYVLTNDNTDITIAPGQTITFGFVATWGTNHVAPANFTFTGIGG